MVMFTEPVRWELVTRTLLDETEQWRPTRMRTMRQFAENEIIIPSGEFEGRRFSVARQPFTGLWFDEVDSGRWPEMVATGPSQSGKSLSCFVIPLIYHLFEVKETVICALPDLDMARDKWERDIEPALSRTRYRDLIPRRGPGSRGGRFDFMRFGNGHVLRFMSGGGSDKARAGFTSRVICFTETDELGKSDSTSVEASKIEQIEARTRSYAAHRRRIYKECTISIAEGHTWQKYRSGTQSQIVLQCPHCREWVVPEREHLLGWEDANTEVAAAENAAFYCPRCSEAWTEDERVEANQSAKLIHSGQTIDKDGTTHGDVPETRTLGFRWSAVNNLLLSSGDVAIDEWRGKRAINEDDAERKLCQFVWAIPYAPAGIEKLRVDVESLKRRTRGWPRGLVPEGCEYLTTGADISKRWIHWTTIAWLADKTGHVVEYGKIDVHGMDFGIDVALPQALAQLHEMCETGWTCQDGSTMRSDQVWIDAGWQIDLVYGFVREHEQEVYRPVIGRGAGQQRRQYYNRPKRKGGIVKHVGEEFHFTHHAAHGVMLGEVNADYWKTWLHRRFVLTSGQAGSITLFAAPPRVHERFSKHITAEEQIEEFVPEKGMIVRWTPIRSENHWLDSTYLSCAAGSFCGVSVLDKSEPDTDGDASEGLRRRTLTDGVLNR